MIKVIKTDEIEEGMKLARHVINGFGQVLLTSGTELTRRHIAVLKTWNIYSISISNGDIEKNEAIPKEVIDNNRETILQNLSWKPRNISEDDLINMASIRKAKGSLSKGDNS